MKTVTSNDLAGKVIDIHSHVGISLKSYAWQDYPYAETIESLFFKQQAAGVDVNVIFPFGPLMFCNIQHYLETGEIIAKDNEAVPYEHENRFLIKELCEYCPELKDRFLPFISWDPGRKLNEQLKNLEKHVSELPCYGIKIVPVLCQTKAIDLLDFPDLFDFAKEYDLPFLFHSSCYEKEEFSYAGDIFKLIEKYSHNRYCLAHCIGFDKGFLDDAKQHQNVWFDTSALKIQVQLAHENSPLMAPENGRVPADYSNCCDVIQVLAEHYPDTIIWGTDSPAYSYLVKRKNSDGSFTHFNLKGLYLQEKQALDSLPETLRQKAANTNTLKFLFGDANSR